MTYTLDNFSWGCVMMHLQPRDLCNMIRTCKTFYDIHKSIVPLKYMAYNSFSDCIRKGDLDCVRYACPLVLKYIHDHPNTIISTMCDANACLVRLGCTCNDHGIPLSMEVDAITWPGCLSYAPPTSVMLNMPCIIAAHTGQFDCMRYLHLQGFICDYMTFKSAVYGGNVKCVEYIHTQCDTWDEWICANAATYGNSNLLKFLHEHGCPWHVWTCIHAAMSGSLECLQYAHEHGCPWNWMVCSSAAMSGSLECLQYAHKHGCPWNEWCTRNARIFNHQDCFDYAIANGCPHANDDIDDQ